MNISIIDGRRNAIGTAPVKVLVDVFRSTSTIPVIIKNNAQCVIPSRTIRQARTNQRKRECSMLVGERFGLKVPGFHYNNSPADVWDVDFSGKTVCFTSTNGTMVLEKIRDFPKIFISSFVNFTATLELLRDEDEVEIVMSGRPDASADEDLIYAEFLRDSLSGNQSSFEVYATSVRNSKGAKRLSMLGYAKDVEKCLAIDHVDFATVYENGRIVRA
ncbi:MAG: 2-phosphosulfolactate phosphatase [Candidatus Thermoplasmatota archaeon]|nr:2-phosphosulfolactate phosphatase [Candidatus Thermoplasmatota archaeon]